MNRRWIGLATLLFLVLGACTSNVSSEERRALALEKQLACPVCATETTLDKVDTPLSGRLKLLIREKIEEGATDEEILQHFRGLYGQNVVLAAATALPARTAPTATIPVMQTQWRKLGPGEGTNQVTPGYDQANPGILYLYEFSVGYWESADRGETWKFVGERRPHSFASTGTDYASLYLDPKEVNELGELLRFEIGPHMEGYDAGQGSSVGLSSYWSFREAIILAPVVWRASSSDHPTYRFLFSPDEGETWAELNGLPVANPVDEVHATLVLTEGTLAHIYIGSRHETTLWYTEISLEDVEGLVP